MRMETFIRKQLKLKAHWVPKVEETAEGVVVWVDRLGRRRACAVRIVCCDMWAVYIDAVRLHLLQATLAFDRFSVSLHLNRAVDEVRRQTWQQMAWREKAESKRTRFLWLSNPENLRRDERTRLSGLLWLNSPIVTGYLLKEDLRRFWNYRSTAWAEAHLRQWLWRAAHSRLEPFTQFVRLLCTYLDGVLAWTRIRVTNGTLEGMNNKVKVISHRAFGYRKSWTSSPTSITAVRSSHYHDYTFGRRALFKSEMSRPFSRAAAG